MVVLAQGRLGRQIAVIGRLAKPLGRRLQLTGALVHRPHHVLGDGIAPVRRPSVGVQRARVVPGPLQRAAQGVAQTPVVRRRLDRRPARRHGLGRVDQMHVHARRRAEGVLRIIGQDIAG